MRTVKLGDPLIQLETVDSTNNYAMSLIKSKDVKEGTVILADFQMKGKGQGGAQWFSDKETNLLFSLILAPDFLMADQQFYISMCVSNALSGFLHSVTGRSEIKWPNDIWAEDRKIAGILIENTLMGSMMRHSVIGIGFNVNQKHFPPEIPNPGSLSLLSGKDFDLMVTLQGILKMLSLNINDLYEGKLGHIRTSYLNQLRGMNQWAVYSDTSGSFEGRIEDVSDMGELIISRRDGTMRQYGFKEISFTL